MTKTKCVNPRLGLLLCAALLGGTTYGQVSVSVGVEIRAQSDFYEPLTPYGEWVVIGSYGRCWRPGRTEAGWRPYCNGYWQYTDAGWYWASDEPWGWATYHYGCWDFNDRYGWYWVPQTRWAPAWVSWHSGGGYIGWAPLYPSGVRVISPRAYVFVEERRFTEPVRPSTVIVNNTTIINKTVINQAPAPAAIEKVSGQKVQALPVQQVRQREEAPVLAKQKTAKATSTKVQPPVGSEAQPAAKKAVAAPGTPQVQKPAAATPQSTAPAPKNGKAQSEARSSAPAAAKSKPAAKPEAKPEANQHPAASKEPTAQKADKPVEKEAKAAKPTDQKALQPGQQKPAATEKSGSNLAEKDHENKPKQ